ncbi:hypothetical protein [Sulfitobacter albidus]|uniref:hypothetical protein n=1 Tax=Sulfitobacter albidus TaxID=2829501 RepID=UPI0020C86A84|nr:hypothetical protein [Sulfitobacter albidus]
MTLRAQSLHYPIRRGRLKMHATAGIIMMQRSIPTYELFGELLSGSYTDPVHHEPIHERSSQHHWTIRLHRHKSLAQVFVFRTPGVSLRVGDLAHTSTAPLALFVPAGVAHGFRFADDVVGDVLSLRISALGAPVAALLARPEMQAGGLMPRARCENFDLIAEAIGRLGQAYHGMQIERAALLETLTQLVLTAISGDLRRETSLAGPAPQVQATRHELQAEQFCALVEKCFREDVSVAGYADRLDVSAPHLTRVCRRILGRRPTRWCANAACSRPSGCLSTPVLALPKSRIDRAFAIRRFSAAAFAAPSACRQRRTARLATSRRGQGARRSGRASLRQL